MGLPGDPAHLRTIGQQPGEPGRASKYDPARGYGQTIRDLAQQGEFPEVWAAECGVTKQTLRNWCEAHPEFREDMVIACALVEAYWSRLPLQHLTNPDLRSSVLLETLRKRFPKTWSETQAHDMREEFGLTQKDEVPLTAAERARLMTREELEAEVERLREQRLILKAERLGTAGKQ